MQCRKQSELLKPKSKVLGPGKNQMITLNTNSTADCSQLSTDN